MNRANGADPWLHLPWQTLARREGVVARPAQKKRTKQIDGDGFTYDGKLWLAARGSFFSRDHLFVFATMANSGSPGPPVFFFGAKCGRFRLYTETLTLDPEL